MQHQQLNKKNFALFAAPLLLVLFIDGMGLGLVFPLLNALLFDPTSHFFTKIITPFMQNVIYGATIGIFMLCWFFGAAMLGDISDQIGRKKSLMICLIGGFIGYLLSALAVIIHSLSLLIIGRMIAGFTSGSQPIAQAAIVDLSPPENKARNLGIMLFAISCGFIAGPLLGGVLSNNQIVHWFGFSTPLYFAALLSLINLFLLSILVKETFIITEKTRIKPHRAIEVFVDAFKHPEIRTLSIIFFIFILGWSSFYSFISLYLLKFFDFTPTKISLIMALMGAGFGIGNGFLVNYFTKRFSLKSNVVISLIISAILVMLILGSKNPLFTWILMCPIGASVTIAYAVLLTIFSNQVDENSQGWVMGISGSIMALVFAIDGIAVSIIASFNASFPLIISVVCLIISSLLTMKYYKSEEINTISEQNVIL